MYFKMIVGLKKTRGGLGPGLVFGFNISYPECASTSVISDYPECGRSVPVTRMPCVRFQKQKSH